MSRKGIRIIVLITIIVLVVLNIKKYQELEMVVPVWSSYDEEYYNYENASFLDKVKDKLSFERFIYSVTKVRLRAPLTYLNREIPLLAYYTPEELQTGTETVYTPVKKEGNLIRLKFNLAEKTDLAGNDRVELNEEKKSPVVAIYHTHTSETYIDDPRKQDRNGHVMPGNIGNVGKVGMELARVLSEKYGFRVIHTTKVHDEVYNRSYYNSRNTVKNLLRENPEIDLILDIHRDGLKDDVSRDAITKVFNNIRIANVMIVIANGKYTYGEVQVNSNWQDNLSTARLLAVELDKLYPGLLRRVEERDTTTNRYNQDLHPKSILIEIGDYRNTTQEAIYAAHCVAEAIAAMFGLK